MRDNDHTWMQCGDGTTDSFVVGHVGSRDRAVSTMVGSWDAPKFIHVSLGGLRYIILYLLNKNL